MFGLRPATRHDCRDVWLWRNDPVSRAASHDTGAIPYALHTAWFDAALADPARILMIGTASDRSSVGLVRLERMADRGLRIGINIAPEWRGRGVGRALLAEVLSATPGARLTADVRSDNLASIRLFSGAGFARRGEADGIVVFERASS
jgi:ribosomal protein S18 acetylase RimI-like enzyme